MALRPMTSFAAFCDWRGCSASADAAPTPAEAEIAWHRDGGMKFLAGRYGGLWDDPVEYLCGEHWHQREGSYRKGPVQSLLSR